MDEAAESPAGRSDAATASDTAVEGSQTRSSVGSIVMSPTAADDAAAAGAGDPSGTADAGAGSGSVSAPLDRAPAASATGGPEWPPQPPAADVKVMLQGVGGAPVLKKNKFKVAAHEPFATVQSFVRRMLRLSESDVLFLYLHKAFTPSPDQSMGTLSESFAVGGQLIVHYSTTNAWG